MPARIPQVIVVGMGAAVPGVFQAACECVELPDVPDLEGLRSVAADSAWVVPILRGEEVQNEPAWIGLLAALGGLPPEVDAVEVCRAEDSIDLRRESWDPRAVRVGALAVPPDPMWGWRVAGRRVRVVEPRVLLDRSASSNAIGRAVVAERQGDWLAAARRWCDLGETRDDAWGAYALLRGARALAQESPHCDEVRARLLVAHGRCPALAEASVALFSWWMGRGSPERALEWALIADAVRLSAVSVPQPSGVETWWVPATVGVNLAAREHPAANSFLREAAGRGWREAPASPAVAPLPVAPPMSAVPDQP